jgi:plasmid stabilization system protein ParE
VKRVEINRPAKDDIARVAAYYKNEKEGLGDKFLDRVQESVDRIALNPRGYAKVIGEARKADLRRFP